MLSPPPTRLTCVSRSAFTCFNHLYYRPEPFLADSSVQERRRRSASKLWHLSKLSGTLSPIPRGSFDSIAP